MEFISVNLDAVTEEELLSCLESNVQTASEKRNKIALLKKLAERRSVSHTKLQEEIITESVESSKDDEFEDEVDYYYTTIKNIQTSDLLDSLETFLPSKNNPNYQRLMYRLQAEILKSIKDLKDYIREENPTGEDLAYLKNEISLEQSKFKRIGQLSLTTSNEDSVTSPQVEQDENSLIFIPTPTGRIRIFEDIENMPIEYFSELYDLFMSIKNSTFKGVKRMKDDSYGGVSEVRGRLLRVIFDRIDKNNYAVITTFAKKFDNTTAYRTMLDSTIWNYLAVEPTLPSALANEECRQLHKQYETELLSKICPPKANSYTKRKGEN